MTYHYSMTPIHHNIFYTENQGIILKPTDLHTTSKRRLAVGMQCLERGNSKLEVVGLMPGRTFVTQRP